MTPSDDLPLRDTLTQPFTKALERAFGCHHSHLSRVFTIDGHSYKVCCDCGARFRYSLRTMSILRRHKHFPGLRRLRARNRRRRFLHRTA